MGVVYSAENQGLGRMDAVKVIKPVLSRDREFRARFSAESRLAASVRHPNVLSVYAAGEEDGLLYLTMQLVNGPDQARILREHGPRSPRRAGALLGDVASALQAAHDVVDPRRLATKAFRGGNLEGDALAAGNGAVWPILDIRDDFYLGRVDAKSVTG